MFGDLGIRGDTARARREFEARMEAARWDSEPEGWRAIRRGWCLGEREFRAELLEEMAEKAQVHHYGVEMRLSLEAQAEKIVRAGLKDLGWSEGDLADRRKGDAGKVAIARKLRSGTTMTADWTARRLRMGSEANVRRLLPSRRDTAK